MVDSGATRTLRPDAAAFVPAVWQDSSSDSSSSASSTSGAQATRYHCWLCGRPISKLAALEEGFPPANAWQSVREWLELCTGEPCVTSSAEELVIEVRRQKHLAGLLSASDMIGNSASVCEVEMRWLYERCPNTKACASRFCSRASWAHVRSEVRMENHWHRQSARHMRFLPPHSRIDEHVRVFVELPPATSHASVTEGQRALKTAQEASGAAYLRLRAATRALLERFETQAAKPSPPRRHSKKQETSRPPDHLVRLFEGQLVRLEVLREAFQLHCKAAWAALGLEESELPSLEETAAHVAMLAIRTPRSSAVPD